MRRATVRAALLAAGAAASSFAASSASASATTAAAHPVRVYIPATEAHALGDDVRVVVATSGLAAITHALRWQVSAGAMHTFDLAGVEESAVLSPEVAITGDDGSHWTAHLSWFAPRVLRVTTDDPHGLHKGGYRFDVRYDVDLPAARELVRDGAMWRLAWPSPNAIEGFDGHVVIDLPAAPTAPRPDMGGERGEDGIVATVQRSAARDTLELERPHVARGESVVWAVRLDPRALPQLMAARENAALSSIPGATSDTSTSSGAELPVVTRWRHALAIFAVSAFGLLYAWTVRRRAGRPLVALPQNVRAAAAGASLAVGLGLHVAGHATVGTASIALAMILATVRAASSATKRPSVRGPGAWTELPASDAFAKRASSRFALVARLTAAASLLALAAAASRFAPPEYALAALDALALLPLLLGGGVEPSPVDRARPLLARAFRSVAKRSELHVAAWGRRPADRTGLAAIDELRLRVVPRSPMPGTGGVELGFAADPSGAASPEVLVRVAATSCASARMSALAPWASLVPGRTPDERVVRLSPRWPSLRLAERLTERVAMALIDRRDETAAKPAFSRQDRRKNRFRVSPVGAPESAPDASLLLLR